MFLALPPGDGSSPTVLSQFALCPALSRTIEPAGRVFEEMVRQKYNDPFFEEIEKEDVIIVGVNYHREEIIKQISSKCNFQNILFQMVYDG